jgi:hypothetical protein
MLPLRDRVAVGWCARSAAIAWERMVTVVKCHIRDPEFRLVREFRAQEPPCGSPDAGRSEARCRATPLVDTTSIQRPRSKAGSAPGAGWSHDFGAEPAHCHHHSTWSILITPRVGSIKCPRRHS